MHFADAPRKLMMTLAATAALAACGGGGGGDDEGPGEAASGTAEGVYEGSLGDGGSAQLAMVVLENGESWAIYSSPSAAGFLHANGMAAAGGYVADDLRDYGVSPADTGSISATYNTSAGTLAGQLRFPSGTVPFAVNRTSNGYRYDTPAALSAIAGAWSLTSTAATELSMQMQIGSDGTVSATSTSGCTMTGTVVPRASGKNIFDTSLRFGSACIQANLAATGIAISLVEDGERVLIMMGQDAGRTVGNLAVGVR